MIMGAPAGMLQLLRIEYWIDIDLLLIICLMERLVGGCQ